MEFNHYNRKIVSKSSSISKEIKARTSKIGLILKKKEDTFKGLGAYLEVDVKQRNNSSNMIKIPFFSTYEKDKFVNIKGINYVNPLAKKIIRRVKKKTVEPFNFETFKAYKINQVDARIALLGDTPEDLEIKNGLQELKNKINNAPEKYSCRFIKNEISYLDNIIKKGLNLRNYSNEEKRKTAITLFCDCCEICETLKQQKKHLTWKQKRGLNKFNNRITRRIGAGVVAGAIALTGSHLLGVTDAIKKLFNKDTAKPKSTASTLIEDSKVIETPKSEISETGFESQIVEQAPVESLTINKEKYDVNNEKFVSKRTANYEKYFYMSEIIGQSPYLDTTYNDMINSLTIIENIDELKVNSSELKNHIMNARNFINLSLAHNNYNELNLQTQTFDIMQKCFDRNYNLGIEFVNNGLESKTPFLDVLAIGQTLESLLDADKLNYFENLYYSEINDYCNAIIEEKLETSKEVIKVLTLNRYNI